jgi:hypothetical protein
MFQPRYALALPFGLPCPPWLLPFFGLPAPPELPPFERLPPVAGPDGPAGPDACWSFPLAVLSRAIVASSRRSVGGCLEGPEEDGAAAALAAATGVEASRGAYFGRVASCLPGSPLPPGRAVAAPVFGLPVDPDGAAAGALTLDRLGLEALPPEEAS